MEKNEYISQLIDRYLDGETTANEERALRGYFTNPENDIPEEWMAYKALFSYIADERKKHDTDEPTVAIAMPTKRKRRHALWFYVATAAASVALVVGLVLNHNHRSLNYTVIDGKVYTNQKMVKDEALEALQMVSSDEDDTFGALDLMR